MAYLNPKTDLKSGANSVEMSIADIQGGSKTTGSIYKLQSAATELRVSESFGLTLNGSRRHVQSIADLVLSGNFVRARAEADEDSDYELEAFVDKYVDV